MIDHKDGDGLNCTRDNMRPASDSQNCQNRGLRADNKSGVAGIFWISEISKWRAYICVMGKQKCLGCFSDKDEAIQVRSAAVRKFFGEFARLKN